MAFWDRWFGGGNRDTQSTHIQNDDGTRTGNPHWKPNADTLREQRHNAAWDIVQVAEFDHDRSHPGEALFTDQTARDAEVARLQRLTTRDLTAEHEKALHTLSYVAGPDGQPAPQSEKNNTFGAMSQGIGAGSSVLPAVSGWQHAKEQVGKVFNTGIGGKSVTVANLGGMAGGAAVMYNARNRGSKFGKITQAALGAALTLTSAVSMFQGHSNQSAAVKSWADRVSSGISGFRSRA